MIIGEPKPHRTLSDLIEYHKKVKISNWKHLLNNACPQNTEMSNKLAKNLTKRDQIRTSENLANKKPIGPPLPKRENLRLLSKTIDPKKLIVPPLPTNRTSPRASPKSSPKTTLKNKKSTQK